MKHFKGTKGEWFPINFSGHWEIHDIPYYPGRNLLDDNLEDDHVIEEEVRANARLASKAYLLLEALQEAVEFHGSPEGCSEQWLNKAKEAINKAL